MTIPVIEDSPCSSKKYIILVSLKSPRSHINKIKLDPKIIFLDRPCYRAKAIYKFTMICTLIHPSSSNPNNVVRRFSAFPAVLSFRPCISTLESINIVVVVKLIH